MRIAALLCLCVLWAAPVSGQARLQDGLLIVGGGLAGADLAVSMDAFARGQAREANPVLRPLMNRPAAFGFCKASLDTGTIIWIRSMRKDHPKRALYAAIGFVVLKAAVIGWNYHALKR